MKNITLQNSLGEALYPKAQLIGIDTTNILATIQGVNWTNYTATEDCVCFLAEYNNQHNKLDGVELCYVQDNALRTFVPLKKGQVLSVCGNGNAGYGRIKVFGMKR